VEPFFRPKSIIDEIEELAREAWHTWQPAMFGTALMPRTDMYEENGDLVLKTELTGVKKEDMDITVDCDVLTVKAEKKQEAVSNDAKQYSNERYFGHYIRSIRLPYHVDTNKASATLENGLLELRFPKAETAELKRIEIKAEVAKSTRKKRSRKTKLTTD